MFRSCEWRSRIACFFNWLTRNTRKRLLYGSTSIVQPVLAISDIFIDKKQDWRAISAQACRQFGAGDISVFENTGLIVLSWLSDSLSTDHHEYVTDWNNTEVDSRWVQLSGIRPSPRSSIQAEYLSVSKAAKVVIIFIVKSYTIEPQSRIVDRWVFNVTPDIVSR